MASSCATDVASCVPSPRNEKGRTSAITLIAMVLFGTGLFGLEAEWKPGESDVRPTSATTPTQTPVPTSLPSGTAVPLAGLTASTTNSTLPQAPTDPRPNSLTDGTVVRVLRPMEIFDQPDGTAFGKLTEHQFGDAWFPVIATREGWVQILLPSRPNSSSAWVRDQFLEKAVSPYAVVVSLSAKTLELRFEDQVVGTWPVAVGASDTPTPAGRTFILGSLVDPNQSFSPVILPLGSHSESLDTYGGGPGTVALHGWSDPAVFGTAISHGCIRVPADALEQLRNVPLGTIVLVNAN